MRRIVDGNEACASVAYRTAEVIAIYPITPASPMGELSDAWAAAGRLNALGTVPEVIEMQSEGGAAGAVHGALQAGALTTTFTASQGLLLMIPNMFKIAGELTPVVIHVAARSIATHALSIFGDHSDVMSARSTGWALLCSSSVQEAHDFAMIAQMATLRSRVPFLHFFDGFRTSHEVNTIDELSDDDVAALLDRPDVRAHRDRGLDPDRPVLRGTAQNPDVFFQAREAINPYYAATPGIVREAMATFHARTGRRYDLFEYVGHPEAEHVVVLMGSGVGAAEEAVNAAVAAGERVGLVKVRLYRPFDVAAFTAALPATTQRIAVLDRTKEPGAPGEPLYLDVVAALAGSASPPRVVGGRYGLSSKEFTPAMVAAVFGMLASDALRHDFTIGITDDVTHTSIPWDRNASAERDDEVRAVFYGLGSDGTVGANKASAKIVGEGTPLFAQGYFVYDSKKSGSVTVSHLRFGPRPIESTYLVQQASFVACHHFGLLRSLDVLDVAAPGAIFLLNSPYGPEGTWDRLPKEVQTQIIEKKLVVHVIDANAVATEAGLGGRINTIMQTCFFALAGLLPADEATARIESFIRKTYGKRGGTIVQRNLDAVARALGGLRTLDVPAAVTATEVRPAPVPATAPDFVQRITSMIIAGRGDLLPVSAMPVDGTFPTGTTQYERRSIAAEIPIWDADLCVDCGLCAIVCPHAAIRSKVFDPAALNGTPEGFTTKAWRGGGHEGAFTRIQVAPDDCTGCGICVETCPARSKTSVKHKAIDMEPKAEHLERERVCFDYFLGLPEADRRDIRLETISGSQLAEPLFEFSGACAGCGETPYLKLLTQLFGDRMIVANATGCSSIYGGNLPTTPWARNGDGRGVAWSNSLFEDNAEFGLGLRLGVEGKRSAARALVERMGADLDPALTGALVDPREHGDHTGEADLAAQRERLAALRERLTAVGNADALDLLGVVDTLADRAVWIVGGDGWAYDIGFGGLDHVLASGRNVNILVLDTEVYSNTGGQASKATPRAASAKFAASGKAIGKKDLGLLAMAYGNVFVAQVALAAHPRQTVRSFLDAASYEGPSLIIAYCPCIAHGMDMTQSTSHQKAAVASGYWPLYHYDPRHAHAGDHPMSLDSKKPKGTFRAFAETEARFAALMRSQPERADALVALAQHDIDERWRFYEQMVGVERTVPGREDES